MKKKLLSLTLVSMCIGISAQLTYVGNGALVHIRDKALVYSGGGVKLDGTAKVNTIGDFMVVSSTQSFEVASTADFRLRYSSPTVYGQLFIKDMPQGNITGKVNKEYVEAVHGTTGRQQVALPFYNYAITDLKATLPHINITPTYRWDKNNVFKWNNSLAVFDPLSTSLTPVVGKATDYYILSRRNKDGTFAWNTTVTAENSTAEIDGTTTSGATASTVNNLKKIFNGVPVSDQNTTDTQVTLSGSFSGSFGTNGATINKYNEKYNSYIDDPFVTPKWGTDYGKNVYQFGNPYLTNLDMSKINQNEANGDDIYIPNIKGFYMYESGILNSVAGTDYSSIAARAVTFDGSGLPVGAVLSDLMVKPMQEFIIKLTNNTSASINFNKLRRFSQTPRTATTYSVTAARTSVQNRTSVSLSTKQLMVVLADANDVILGKAFYVLNDEATTGFIPEKTIMQAVSSNTSLYTKEEQLTGGADASATYNLYINEANEVDFAGKEVPLVVNNTSAAKLKFFLIENGNLVAENSSLSNGKSFYFGNSGTLTKIKSGDVLPLTNTTTTYGLFYEQPAGTLGTSELLKGQTVVAKKDLGYVVRFNKNWKQADVEMYSSVGQLLHSAKKVSTFDDYELPIDNTTKGVYIIKIKSNEGEIVTKKIIK